MPHAPVRPIAPVPRGAFIAVALSAALGLAAAPAGAQDGVGSVTWADGPVKGNLGGIADVQVPEGCRFTEKDGARAFMIATENPPSGHEQGVLVCPGETEDGTWFVVFSYDPSGYVKDDDKDKLDANAILATLRRGNEHGNELRRSRGWEELTLDGWIRPPYYDSATHNLTWATKVSAASSGSSVNHSVRLLGRGGVMHVDLVMDPAQFEAALPKFDAMVAGTTFRPGNTYGEWREGDKVAAYGLTALVAGGAGAAAAKLGLFGKLWKLIVAILLAAKKAVVLVVAGVFAWVRSLFRKREAAAATAGGPPASGDTGPTR